MGALGFWFLCARGRAHRCGTGFGAEDLDAVAASSTQAYGQHKLLHKFTRSPTTIPPYRSLAVTPSVLHCTVLAKTLHEYLTYVKMCMT